MQNDFAEKAVAIETCIGYCFQDQELLKLALTHPSLSGEMKKSRTQSNQRLEFLGDAVLECVVSDHLYRIHRDLEEGELTRMRASLVCEAALSCCAEKIRLGEYLLLGKGEASSGGRKKPSILSDAFEALIGAIYLDGGFLCAKKFIETFVIDLIEEFSMLPDGKSRIQELVQKDSGATLSYETTEKENPETGFFETVLSINGKEISRGSGRTKKAAEQKAALDAVNMYQSRQTFWPEQE